VEKIVKKLNDKSQNFFLLNRRAYFANLHFFNCQCACFDKS